MSGSVVDTSAVTVRFEIPDLGFSTVLGFDAESTFELAKRHLFGRISGARLPAIQYARLGVYETPTLWIDIHPLEEDRADVGFRGAVESPVYRVDLDGFHWDFSKVVNCLVMESAIESQLLPVHAACLRVGDGSVLLPGASGAGKSSIAYAAIGQGVNVLASELAFVRDGRFICGNRALTIDRAAIRRFSLECEGEEEAVDGTRIALRLPVSDQVEVSRILFPQVHPGPLQMRSITARRARMLLFENVVTQLPVVQLLAQESWPMWRPPARDKIDRVMDEIATLSGLDPVIIEGHPLQIAAAISSEGL